MQIASKQGYFFNNLSWLDFKALHHKGNRQGILFISWAVTQGYPLLDNGSAALMSLRITSWTRLADLTRCFLSITFKTILSQLTSIIMSRKIIEMPYNKLLKTHLVGKGSQLSMLKINKWKETKQNTTKRKERGKSLRATFLEYLLRKCWSIPSVHGFAWPGEQEF